MTDYGRDFYCNTDFLPTFAETSGAELMAQVCMRRIYTTPGSLFSAPLADVIDVRTFLSSEVDPSRAEIGTIKGACTAAILADPRVLSVTVDPTWQPREKTLLLAINGQGSDGPFQLTLAVSAVTVELLQS